MSGEFEGLDLSFLGGMDIPEIGAKTTKKETVQMPEKAEELEGEEGTSPISEAEEVESFEDLLKKQEGTKTGKREVVKDDDKPEIVNEPVEDTEEEVETTETTETEEVSPIKAWAEYLREKSIIDFKDDEFEDSEDFLDKKYVEKIKSGVEEYKESLPEVIKELVNNYEEGVPLVELIESKSRQTEYSAITKDQIAEDEKLQENLIMNWLLIQEYDEDEAKEKLTDYKDSGLLEKEARTAHNKLIKYEEKYQTELKLQTEKARQEQEKQQIEQLKQLENNINTKPEIIPNMPLTKEAKAKIFNGITKRDAKGYTEIQKKMADPEMQLKVAQFVLLHNGSFDDVLKQAKTTVAKETKKNVTTYKETPSKLGQVDIKVALAAAKAISKNK